MLLAAALTAMQRVPQEYRKALGLSLERLQFSVSRWQERWEWGYGIRGTWDL